MKSPIEMELDLASGGIRGFLDIYPTPEKWFKQVKKVNNIDNK